MGKENEKKLDEKKGFCPSSEVPTLRWFQNVGAGSWLESWELELALQRINLTWS